jgi:DNA-binding transcriptional LysR family regulator
MDRLGGMQVVVAIADGGSLTAAADALGMSLPTVVRRLAALERQVGVRLFHRTTRRVGPTDEGRLFVDRCRAVLAAVEDAEAAVSERVAVPRGRISITASELFGRRFVTPIACRVASAHPQLSVELLLTDRVTNLVEEGVDVAIRLGQLADSSLVAHRVGEVRRVVCASPAYLKRQGAIRQPRDLAGRRCVSFTSVTPGSEWRFRDGSKALGVKVPVAFACNQVDAAMQACIDGLGPGAFLSYQVAEARAAGKLKYVLEAFEPPPLPVSIVYPHARHRSAAVRLFVEECRESLRAAKLA